MKIYSRGSSPRAGSASGKGQKVGNIEAQERSGAALRSEDEGERRTRFPGSSFPEARDTYASESPPGPGENKGGGPLALSFSALATNAR
ncbi:hypothetical protein KM043_004160 [Ampulex compressa]|nr:hypothetical protein KM043_004160 [Ampulex compressa]